MMNQTVGRADVTTLVYTEMDSPIGPLTLGTSDLGVCSVVFGKWEDNEGYLTNWTDRWYPNCNLKHDDDALSIEAKLQLKQFFANERKEFELPLDLRGTPFQLRVWQALQNIPFGQTASYKDVAGAIGSPKAVRAVGGANNRNPVSIIVPCHRVIGANGQLVGYGGGLDIKQVLLQLEK